MKFRAIFRMAHFCLYVTCHMQNSPGGWKTKLPEGPGISDSRDTYKYYGTFTDLLEKENNSGFT